MPPADYLVALAGVFSRMSRGEGRPDQVEIAPGRAILPERHIAQDTPNLFGGWIIHKENFRAPKILEVARLQAWTLKPAIRRAN